MTKICVTFKSKSYKLSNMYGSLYDERNTVITNESNNIFSKDGYKFKKTSDPDSVHLFLDEESVRRKYFYPFLRKGLRLLDIGCGVGSYSLPALVRGGYVTAMCPPSPYSNAFITNVRLNSNFEKNVDLIPFAAYSQDGYVNPMTRHFVNGYYDIPEHYKSINLDFMTQVNYYFPCSTVDNLVKDKGYFDFIKIDVEGLEEDVIRGAKNTIKYRIPYILIENHLFKDPGIEKRIVDILINEWQLPYKFESSPYSNTASTFFYSHTLFTPL